jgi:Ca2+-binding EF-hand superfamily protein
MQPQARDKKSGAGTKDLRRRATIDSGPRLSAAEQRKAMMLDGPLNNGAASSAENLKADLRPPPPSVDLKACQLAARFKLTLYETKKIIEEFEKAVDQTDGSLTLDQFQVVLSNVFQVKKVAEKVLNSAYDAANCRTGVNLEKFLEWYIQMMFTDVNALNCSPDKTVSEKLVYDLAKQFGVSVLIIDKVKQKFDHFDGDRSGRIDHNEFKQMMVVVMKAKKAEDLNKDRIDKFWKEIDKDGSGDVDFSEFTEWYLKYFNPDANHVNDFNTAGPVESFYDSFDPMVQRRNSFQNSQSRRTVE